MQNSTVNSKSSDFQNNLDIMDIEKKEAQDKIEELKKNFKKSQKSTSDTTTSDSNKKTDVNEVADENLANNSNSENLESVNQDSVDSKEYDVKTTENQEVSFLQAELSKTLTELEITKKEVKDWQEKAVKINDELLKIKSTLDITSRQAKLDSEQAARNSKKSVMITILPFLNALNLAFGYTQSNPEQILKALETTKEKLISDLSAIGVQVLYASENQEFDPEYMNAINSVDGDFETLLVANMVTPGLKISDILIQPVSVLVKIG